MDLRDKQAFNNGFGEALSRAFELAVTPAIFAVGGWWLDGRLGVFPLLTVVLLAFGVTGTFAKVWYAYDREMRDNDIGKPWARSRGGDPAR